MANTPMLTASGARAKASNDRVIFDECRSIESAILDSVDDGAYEVSVTGTIMTSSIGYYTAWAGVTTDRAKTTQMNAVVDYFVNLGYSIERRLDATTGHTFLWYVAW